MAQLNGRVFTRLQQYDALPTELKNETERLEECLTTIQTEVFDTHRTLTLKSVYGVRVRPLLERIEAWVKDKQGTSVAPASTLQAAANLSQFENAASGTQVPVVTGPTDPTVGMHIPRAKKLLTALVLKGFVTPEKEDKPDELRSATEELDFKDDDLLVAVGKRIVVPKNAMTTVWDLVDGAVFAGMIKRKTGLLEPLTHGKSEYIIVNARHKNVTFFSSDLGREPKLQLAARSLLVAFEESHYENGVKFWTEQGEELVNASSQLESDALVQALLVIGASHDKVFNNKQIKSDPQQVRLEVKQVVDKVTSGPEAQMGTGDNKLMSHQANANDKETMKPYYDTQHVKPAEVPTRIMDLTHGHNNPHNLDKRADENEMEHISTTKPTDTSQSYTNQPTHAP